MTLRDKESVSYARLRTLMRPEVLLRGLLFALRALLYFFILAELILLVYVLKALVYGV
jgi:hypothetical protein